MVAGLGQDVLGLQQAPRVRVLESRETAAFKELGLEIR